jgi:hypothetical protein
VFFCAVGFSFVAYVFEDWCPRSYCVASSALQRAVQLVILIDNSVITSVHELVTGVVAIGLVLPSLSVRWHGQPRLFNGVIRVSEKDSLEQLYHLWPTCG